MSDLDPSCRDCGVGIGDEHTSGCDVARCLTYGSQRIQCQPGKRMVVYGTYPWGSPIVDWEPDGHDCGRDVWSGEWPGVAECREFGWWAVFVPYGNPSWLPCPPDTPGAVPDLNRLVIEARWDATARRWVAPVEEPTDG